MLKRYLIHYILRDKEDKFKHIHQSMQILNNGYIESLEDAELIVRRTINQKDKDNYNRTIVSWQML